MTHAKYQIVRMEGRTQDEKTIDSIRNAIYLPWECKSIRLCVCR